MEKTLPALGVFVGGAFVGPLLYELLPPNALFTYGLGPMLWPVQVIGPVAAFFGSTNYGLLLGLNILLFALVGIVVVIAAKKNFQALYVGTMLDVAVTFLALSAVRFHFTDILAGTGEMLIALIIAVAFYAMLVFLTYAVVKKHT